MGFGFWGFCVLGAKKKREVERGKGILGWDHERLNYNLLYNTSDNL